MTKQELVTDLKRFTNAGVITKSEILSFLGRKDRSVVSKYVQGLSAIDGKYYYIPDIAERMIELEKGTL